MTTLQGILKRSSRQIIRRLYMKRVQLDGTYESSWFNISEYVVQWGTITESYGDNVFLGAYEVDTWDMVLNNRTRKFQEISDSNSLFNGYRTRFKTRFKIDISYIDPDDGITEVSGRSWFGIMFSTPQNSDNGQIVYSISNILKVFQLYPASGISTANGTTAELVDRLVKKTVNGARLFDQFFEGANDSERYSINPDAASVTTCTSIAVGKGATVWDKIKEYSLIDDFFPYVDNTGNLIWDTKEPTATEQWKFNGGGSFDNDYGINIRFGLSERVDWDNIWNRVVITYDTNGSAQVSEDTWTPGDGSTQDIYGERTFEYTLIDLDSATVATVGGAIQSEYKPAKKIVRVPTKLIPQLKPKDKVEINFSGEITVASPFTWGISAWSGSDPWAGNSGPINLNEFSGKIIFASHDLDNLVSSFDVREA